MKHQPEHKALQIIGPAWHSQVRVMLAEGSEDLGALMREIAALAGMDAIAAMRSLLAVEGITYANGRWKLAESEAE